MEGVQGDALSKLYESYNKLNDAGDKIAQQTDTYKVILSCIKGNAKEKQLCIQFISKFFLNFPDLFNESIDAVLDFLEDDDQNIRLKAIREIPNICKKRREAVAGITDILTQMLVVEDKSERALVSASLITIANCDPKAFFKALFPHMDDFTDLRGNIMNFIRDKFNQIDRQLLTKEIEEYVLEGFMNILKGEVSQNEFEIVMHVLSDLKISKSLTGHNAMLSIIKNKAEMTKPFNATDLEFVHKFLMCIDYGLKYFSKFCPSTDFFKFILENILPNYAVLKKNSEFTAELQILQCLGQISPFISPEIDSAVIGEWQQLVLKTFFDFVPAPPEVVENSENVQEFEFSHIESLLFTFHQLCKFNPGFFGEPNADELKNFRIRLQYLNNGVQSYSSKLQRIRSSKTAEELKKPENQITLVALKVAANIKALILDFFKNPPACKASVKLSCHKEKSQKAAESISSPKVADAVAGGDCGVTEVRKRPLITAPENSSPPKKAREAIAPRGRGNQNPYKKVNTPNSQSSRGNNKNGSNSFRGRGGFRGGFGNRGSFRGGRGRKTF